MRPALYGSRHAVSAGHYLASAAAFSILEAGGNAIDAGCCAGMALAVLHPDEVNFAGDAGGEVGQKVEGRTADLGQLDIAGPAVLLEMAENVAIVGIHGRFCLII